MSGLTEALMPYAQEIFSALLVVIGVLLSWQLRNQSRRFESLGDSVSSLSKDVASLSERLISAEKEHARETRKLYEHLDTNFARKDTIDAQQNALRMEIAKIGSQIDRITDFLMHDRKGSSS